MKMNGTQIIQEISKNIKNEIGRHLYGVLGTYSQLEKFKSINLSHLKDVEGNSVPSPVNLNQAFLEKFPDEFLRELVRSESKTPTAVQDKLNKAFSSLLSDLLMQNHVLVLDQIELLFAYQMDLQILRAHAANQNHIILLLPGEFNQSGVHLFTEASTQFQRALPPQLITENHLWEITDAF